MIDPGLFTSMFNAEVKVQGFIDRIKPFSLVYNDPIESATIERIPTVQITMTTDDFMRMTEILATEETERYARNRIGPLYDAYSQYKMLYNLYK